MSATAYSDMMDKQGATAPLAARVLAMRSLAAWAMLAGIAASLSCVTGARAEETHIVVKPLAPPVSASLSGPIVLPSSALPSNVAPSVLPPPATVAAAGVPIFKSETEAFSTGMRSYSLGDKPGAVRALEYAAVKGHPRALWKLGRMYAEGDGVDHDDLKAFEYFSKVADDNADVMPGTPNSGFVSSAFVSLGGYLLRGIPGSYVKADPRKAIELFQYAATYFGDPGAQYSLGRLHLDGETLPKDPRRAAQWLNLAAEKGYVAAQALLGQMLVNGTGVPRQRALGLMWITLAKEGADPAKDGWILDLHEQVMANVTTLDQQAAAVYLDRYAKKRP